MISFRRSHLHHLWSSLLHQGGLSGDWRTCRRSEKPSRGDKSDVQHLLWHRLQARGKKSAEEVDLGGVIKAWKSSRFTVGWRMAPSAIAETGSCSACNNRALVFPCSGCCMDGSEVKYCSTCIGRGVLGHSFPFAGAAGQHRQPCATTGDGAAQAPAQAIQNFPPEREARDICVIPRQPLAVVMCRDGAQTLGKRGREGQSVFGHGGMVSGQGAANGPLCSPSKRVRIDNPLI